MNIAITVNIQMEIAAPRNDNMRSFSGKNHSAVVFKDQVIVWALPEQV